VRFEIRSSSCQTETRRNQLAPRLDGITMWALFLPSFRTFVRLPPLLPRPSGPARVGVRWRPEQRCVLRMIPSLSAPSASKSLCDSLPKGLSLWEPNTGFSRPGRGGGVGGGYDGKGKEGRGQDGRRGDERRRPQTKAKDGIRSAPCSRRGARLLLSSSSSSSPAPLLISSSPSRWRGVSFLFSVNVEIHSCAHHNTFFKCLQSAADRRSRCRSERPVAQWHSGSAHREARLRELKQLYYFYARHRLEIMDIREL